MSEYVVRIFDDFYEGDMDPVRGLPTNTLEKKSQPLTFRAEKQKHTSD